MFFFSRVASDAPVPAVCRVPRLIRTGLRQASGSRPVPRQVCDGSTWASPRRPPLCLPSPDKEPDVWQNETGFRQPQTSWQEPKKQPRSIDTSPADSDMAGHREKKKKKSFGWLTHQPADYLAWFFIYMALSYFHLYLLWTHQSLKAFNHSFMQMCTDAKTSLISISHAVTHPQFHFWLSLGWLFLLLTFEILLYYLCMKKTCGGINFKLLI